MSPPKLSDRERLLSGPTYRPDGIKGFTEHTKPIAEPNGFAIIDAAGDLHLRKFCDYCDCVTSNPADMKAHVEANHKCADCGGYAKLKPWMDYTVQPPRATAWVCSDCLITRKKAEYAKRRATIVN